MHFSLDRFEITGYKGASKGRRVLTTQRKGKLHMTDLVKVYATPAAAKGACKKADIDAAAVVVKGGKAAIVPNPKHRSHVIRTPQEMTIREYVWLRCNELQPNYETYKLLRRAVIDDAARQGFKLSGIQAEISRWRHRFN